MNRSLVRVLWVIHAGCFAGTSALAAETFFTDRTAFEAALASPSIDNFDDITVDTSITATPTARDGYSLSLTSGTLSIDAFNSGVSGVTNTTTTVGGIVHTNSSVVFEFNSPISGVGFDFEQFDADLYIQIGNPPQTATAGFASLGGFYGVVSDMPFTELRIFNSSAGNAAFALDNLTFGIPEPATSSISLTLLAGAGFYRRRT